MKMKRCVPGPSTTAAVPPSPDGWRRWARRLPLLLAAALACGAAAGCKDLTPAKMTPDDPFAGLADCKGIPLAADGSLDVNLKSVRISGKVTLNGSALPDGTDDRGTIAFVEKHTGTRAQLPLGTQGPGQYAALLAAAEYEVSYVPSGTVCTKAGNKLPCLGGVLKSGLKLTMSGVLDLDLQTVAIAGKITVNGAAVPGAEKASAAVTFIGTDGGSLSTADLGTFLDDYRVVLLQGSYDIYYEPQQPTCSRSSVVPCIGGPLKKALALTASGVFDLNLPAVKLSGRITVNGQAPSAADLDQGRLIFHLHDGDDLSPDEVVPATTLAPYQLTLLAGTYDVLFDTQNPTCDSLLPCIAGTVKQDVTVSQSGVLDVDIPSIQVQGTVTVAGQPVDAASQQSTLVFVGADKSEVRTVDFGAQQLSDFRVSLIPGVYQIKYAPADSTNCDLTVGRAPCIDGVVKADVALQKSGTLDVDVPVIKVTGRVTLNGTDVSSDALTQGQVAFVLKDGGTIRTADLSAYGLRLLPGSYTMNYGSSAGTQVCSPTAQTPCNSGPIKENVSLSQSGTMDLDIPMVHVSGRVTLDGMPMPDTSEDRGLLMFVLSHSAASTPPFGSSGVVTYSVALLKGAYKLGHYPMTVTCDADRKIPCVGQVPLGCD